MYDNFYIHILERAFGVVSCHGFVDNVVQARFAENAEAHKKWQ